MTEQETATFINPLEETLDASRLAEPCVLVIFGATGDLTARRLIPALYNLAVEGCLPAHFACVGFARRVKDHDLFRSEMRAAIEQFSRTQPIDEEVWELFSKHLFYHRSEFDNDDGYSSLCAFLKKIDSECGTKGNRVYYLSTPASYFPTISEKLSQHNLIYKESSASHPWSRVIIEKPFGHDLNSAKILQKQIGQFLKEEQIYRIDHWLGKETVQNLLVFRFSNSIFESLWNNRHIDHVQITVAEEIGIGTRGNFWEESGMLRDIVQNHVMQLLSLVAMEPPASLSASSIHEEKVKVLQSIRPIPTDEMEKHAIRGQYGPGYIKGTSVKGYREEEFVSPTSKVETYAALRLCIDNWRWAGVPFYLRAGKRLPKRATEIVITFRPAPGSFFKGPKHKPNTNTLVIRIQPNEGISLKIHCKVPGMTSAIQPVKMDFRYGSFFGTSPPEAYERLICDCMTGDSTLFARIDEVLASWELLTPILEHWGNESNVQLPNYSAGMWGPDAAETLLTEDNRRWHLP